MAGKKRTVRVAMIKAESAWGDLKGNVKFLEKLCAQLKGRKIDVVITPECFLDGYMVRDRRKCSEKKLLAQSVTGPKHAAIKRVGLVAKRLKSYVVVGASERDRKGVIRNAAYLLDRKGGHVATYYKVQPCEYYKPGDDLPVFKTDLGTVGIVICADRRWPENIRVMKVRGAELILNPTWGFKGDMNTAIMRTRAYENGIPVCFTHPTQSLICHADGSVGAFLESTEPDILVHTLDLNLNVKAKRTKDKAGSKPAMNRRPELYGDLTAQG
jgi:predicted amidohydrolase